MANNGCDVTSCYNFSRASSVQILTTYYVLLLEV